MELTCIKEETMSSFYSVCLGETRIYPVLTRNIIYQAQSLSILITHKCVQLISFIVLLELHLQVLNHVADL
jgi:hypothetical protein